jgi:outer membrane lipoprotein-sorting protein
MRFKPIFAFFILLLNVTIVLGFTSEEAIKNIRKRSSIRYCPFSATMTSKVVMGQNKQVDSGTIYYSPTGCSKVEMFKSKTVYSSCNDTSWYKMPNGDVTRSINKDDALGFSKNQATIPDFGGALEKYSGKIIETLGDSALTFEVSIPIKEKEIQKMRLTFDTKMWLLRKIIIYGGQMGETVATYAFTQFNGQPMLKEVSMVLGNMGFMVMTYSDYKKNKNKEKSFFKLY